MDENVPGTSKISFGLFGSMCRFSKWAVWCFSYWCAEKKIALNFKATIEGEINMILHESMLSSGIEHSLLSVGITLLIEEYMLMFSI